MRICYVADIGNSHTRRWAGAFAALGHETLVLTDYASEKLGALPPGVRVAAPSWKTWEKILAFKLYPGPYANNRWKYLPYRRALGDFKPDLIHGMEALFNGYTTARLLGPKGPPRILMPWGNDVEYDPFCSEAARRLVAYALRNVEHVVGNTPNLAAYLHERFGVPLEKVTGFSWGVDLGIFRPGLKDAAEAMRAKIGIPPRARVVLSPRNFAPYWQVDAIVRAVPGVVARNPNVFFVFLTGVCDRPFVEENLLFLKWKNVAHHAHVVPQPLTPGEMAVLFSAADVFVSVPRTDFLALTLLEGMACGCVPICRGLPIYGARVKEGVTGRYAPDPFGPETLAETIVSALADREALQRMSRNAAAQALALDDAREGLRKMAEVYAKVTGRSDVLLPEERGR
jgi:glycosyltransferase involved in cell wall biosynthesis